MSLLSNGPLRWDQRPRTLPTAGVDSPCWAGRRTWARNYFSHSILGCLTQSVFNLLGGLGVVSSSSAENTAWMNGTTDFSIAAQRLTNDLMNSPSHRANILNANFTHVGIGSWRTAPGQTWSGGGAALTNVWITAQIFGRMRPAPAVGLSPTSLSFGDRTVSTSSPTQAVTVKNTDDAALTVDGASLAGTNAGEFSITANGRSTGAAGGSCTVSVAFAPGSAGSKSATLRISDNAVGSPHAVSLTGNGTAAAVTLPGIPLNVRATTGGDAQISVSWSPAGSGAPVNEYAMYLWHADGYAGQNKRVCTTCLTSGFTGLTNGKAYFLTVYGIGAGGWSSPGYSTWTTVAAKPGAPTGLKVVPGLR